MPQVIMQVPSIVLPTLWVTGLETEDIDDVVEHTSIEFPVEYIQEKQVHIMAMEVVPVAGAPGNLWCWIELSPLPTVNNPYWLMPLPVTGAYWAAIGGGGGALAPVVPVIEVGVGVNFLVHTILIPWAIHSVWARVVVQTPVLAATSTWTVQVIISGKTP